MSLISLVLGRQRRWHRRQPRLSSAWRRPSCQPMPCCARASMPGAGLRSAGRRAAHALLAVNLIYLTNKSYDGPKTNCKLHNRLLMHHPHAHASAYLNCALRVLRHRSAGARGRLNGTGRKAGERQPSGHSSRCRSRCAGANLKALELFVKCCMLWGTLRSRLAWLGGEYGRHHIA